MRFSSTRFGVATVAILATLAMAACGGDSGSPTSPTPPAPAPGGGTGGANVTVNIGNLAFGPASATVRVGQTVAWRNADSVPHTATANGGAFDTGTIAAGATSAPITMTTAGTYPYFCGFHPAMLATLVVTP